MNVGIVSLSSGIVGEPSIRFEVDIGLRRLKEYGLNVVFMPHALMGLDYIKAHPEKRAQDLLQAFRDPQIDMILCAIGGDDTYRLLPYLFDHGETPVEEMRREQDRGLAPPTLRQRIRRLPHRAEPDGASVESEIRTALRLQPPQWPAGAHGSRRDPKPEPRR